MSGYVILQSKEQLNKCNEFEKELMREHAGDGDCVMLGV
jgi:hypothetical protein